jgi:Family of unknown function (DUF5681)
LAGKIRYVSSVSLRTARISMAARGRPFQPGQTGNPGGRPKERPLRNALKAIIEGDAKAVAKIPGDLAAIARKLIEKAKDGDMPAWKEFADRYEGRVPQAIVGDDEHDAIRIKEEVTDERRVIALKVFLAKNGMKVES